MREVTAPRFGSDDDEINWMGEFSGVDWRACSDEALAEFDSQLKPFGLELVTVNRGDDQYWFRVAVRIPPIGEVTPEQVLKVYSGKPGCGCGCNGKYWVNPAHKELADEERGYAYEGSEVSMTQVKRVLRIVQERADEVKADTFLGETDLLVYAVEDLKRYYWVYVLVQRTP